MRGTWQLTIRSRESSKELAHAWRRLPAENRTIPLETISQRTKLTVDGVEFLLMKTLSLHLVEGIIDQVDSTVQVAPLLLASCTAIICCACTECCHACCMLTKGDSPKEEGGTRAVSGLTALHSGREMTSVF